MKKHKASYKEDTKINVKQTSESHVDQDVKKMSKDTTHSVVVITDRSDLDTDIDLAPESFTTTAAIEDSDAVLPDGSSISWVIDTGRKTISITASTPRKKIPVTLHATNTKTIDGTTTNSHLDQLQGRTDAKSDVSLIGGYTTSKSEKIKDKSTFSPPAILLYICLLLIVGSAAWYIYFRKR